MAKHAVVWLGLVAALAVFAIVNGLVEYRIARSARPYVVVDGVERNLTPSELASSFLFGEMIRAAPIGVAPVGILILPLALAARRLRSFPGAIAFLVGVAVGAVAGGALSLFAWVLLGGWAPPFLLPSAAAGAVLALACVAASRGQRLRNRAPQPVAEA